MLPKPKYLIIALLAFLSACKGNPFAETEPTTTDPVIRARELNDSAIDLVSDNLKLADNALKVFDASAALDSSYDKPLINKLGLLIQLKRYAEALETSEKLQQLRAEDPDLVACCGILYRLNGDSANMQEYLNLAMNGYRNALSNLDPAGPVYEGTLNKLSLLLLLSGRNAEAAKLNPEMAAEALPGDAQIVAEFWKAIRPL